MIWSGFISSLMSNDQRRKQRHKMRWWTKDEIRKEMDSNKGKIRKEEGRKKRRKQRRRFRWVGVDITFKKVR